MSELCTGGLGLHDRALVRVVMVGVILSGHREEKSFSFNPREDLDA